jgi:hypothetical protein
MTTPDVLDKRFAQGPPLPHTGSYRTGCRCPDCRRKHNDAQAGYSAASYRKKQAELEQLRRFKFGVLDLLATIGEQVTS